jgi:hypothetical protein
MLFINLSSYIIYGNNDNNNFYEIEFNINFDKPIIEFKDEYLLINFNNSNGCLYHSNKPIIPFISRNYSFPLGSKIIRINYDYTDIRIDNLSKKIIPSPEPIIPGLNKIDNNLKMDPKIYNSNDLYPENWYKIFKGGGINKGEHKTFLNIRIFPIRYSPKSDKIYFIENINFKITLKIPDENIITNDTIFDLILISPVEFSDQLQPLINHKNNIGINTSIKFTEEIYNEYNGFDEAEEIKLFIKDSLESWNTKCFLLIGGMKSLIIGDSRDDKNIGFKDWYLPVRYSNLKEGGSTYDPGFISDLYFADIYDSEGNFSTWDSNDDGIFGKWSLFTGGRDIIDLYPDVYIGRLPCRNKNEVKIMVDKIITYETLNIDSSWYDKIVLVAGDPFNDSIVGTNFFEGELIADKIASYMDDFEKIKLYSSNRYTNPDETPLTKNIIREFNEGCGHIFFDGHGNPGSWNTGWENGEPILDGGINVYDVLSLSNGDKTPLCIIGGCHTSQFNISLFSTTLNKPYTWTYGLPVAECLGWHLTRKIDGGSIATIGNTGLGYEAEGEFGDRDGDGLNEPDCVEAWGGYLERCFYKSFADSNMILGESWANAIKSYLDVFPGMESQWDTKVIEEWVLIGDPSLNIGGKLNEKRSSI